MYVHGHLPHPHSPAGRRITHSDVKNAFAKKATGRYLTVAEGQKIADVAKTWIGTKYRAVGSASKKNVVADCSGAMHAIYEEAGFTYPYQSTASFEAFAKKSGRFMPSPGNVPQVGDVGYWRKWHRGHMVIYDPKANEYLTEEQLQKKARFHLSNTWLATGHGYVYQATPQSWFDKRYGAVKWYRYCLDK